MEYRRPSPRIDTDRREAHVISFHWMAVWDPSGYVSRASEMEEHVEQRKRDRSWLLHSSESPERPFAIVLVNLRTQFDCSVSQ